MKFKFTCELCKKEVKRGDHFNLDLWVQDDENSSTGEECVDDMCKQCANKIIKKIKSMRLNKEAQQ